MTNLDLAIKSQGQPKVMVYTNYDGPESPMLHGKFY